MNILKQICHPDYSVRSDGRTKKEQTFDFWLTFLLFPVTIKTEQMFDFGRADYGNSGEYVNSKKA
jgi:hypothetical protein